MLRELGAVYRKELRAYFVSPVAYIVIALFSGILAYRFFFYEEFFIYDKAELYRGFFYRFDWILVVLVPVIGMRQWSSEYFGGTIETLMTLPVRTTSLVLGKYFAALTLIGVSLIGTAGIPVTVSFLGDMDWGPVIGGYVGALLFAGALLALGVWLSALTRHQIIAFVLTLLSGAFFVVMYAVADDVGGLLGPVFEQLSLASHYQALGRGVLDMRDVFYFLSFMGFFLYLNVQAVENRRYR
jgi:ABC-2 type transport system permease protein